MWSLTKTNRRSNRAPGVGFMLGSFALRDGPHRLAVLGQSQAKHREHKGNLSVVCLPEDQVYLPTMPPALGSLPCRKCFHQRWRRSFPFKISSVGPVLRKKMLNGRRRDTRRLL